MKRNKITIYFTSNDLYIKNKNKITTHKLLSVDNFKVINSSLFISEISSIFKELHINKNILTDNIDILIDSSYNKQDIFLLETIFKELSFNQINYIYWIDKTELKKNTLLVNISNNIKIHYLHKTISINIIYDKYIEILSTYLNILINKYNIKSIKLFGDNASIYSIREELDKLLNINVYIFSNTLLYPLELLR